MNQASKNIDTKVNAYKSEHHLTKSYYSKQMKKLIGISIVFCFIFTNNTNARYTVNSSEFNYFYQTLAPHGEWLELDHNSYVWRPARVGRNWSPYSEGRWVWSNDGWYWDSYEEFGWATYHYGRWYYDNFYGWVWSPGYEWAPAWVEWRYDDNYVGWAPLPPYAYLTVNSGIHFSISWHSPYSRWRFVNYNRFTDHYLGSHYIDKYKVRNFFSRTKYLTNYHYKGKRIVNRGIRRSEIEKRGRIKIRETEMHNVSSIRNRNSRNNDRNSVRVFRPSEIRTEHSRNNRSTSYSNNSDRFFQKETSIKKREREYKSDKEARSIKKVYNKQSGTKKEKDFPTQKSARAEKFKETQKKKSSKSKTVRNNRNTQKIKTNTSNSTSRNNAKENKSKSKTKSDTSLKRKETTSTKTKSR